MADPAPFTPTDALDMAEPVFVAVGLVRDRALAGDKAGANRAGAEVAAAIHEAISRAYAIGLSRGLSASGGDPNADG